MTFLDAPHPRSVPRQGGGKGQIIPDQQSLFRNASLFMGLSDAERSLVLSRGQSANFDKDEVIICEGSVRHAILIVTSGLIACRRTSPAGLLFVIHNAHPGEFAGEFSLISDGPSEVEVVALRPSTALVFSASEFRKLMERFPSISRRMIEEMAGRISRLSDLSFELATMKVDVRVSRAIAKLARETDQFRDGGVIRPAPTHAELATMVGTTREVVSRSLTTLCRQGSIKTSRQEILIRSVNRLAGDAERDRL